MPWNIVWNMAVRVEKFSNGEYKIRKIFAYESTCFKEIIEFWVLDYLTSSCQKEPKFDFRSQLCMWKIIRIFLRLFFIKEYQVRNTFFVIEVCWQNIFLNHFIHKMMPYFNSSPLIKNSKFHNSIISFGYVDSSAKISVIFLILSPTPLENSTTRIAIVWNNRFCVIITV